MTSLYVTLQQARLYVGPSPTGRIMTYCPRCKKRARLPEGALVCSGCTRDDVDRALREYALRDARAA